MFARGQVDADEGVFGPEPGHDAAVYPHLPAGVGVVHQEQRAGALLLVHNAYPGWQVRVDGRIVPWFRAEYAFIGIHLPPGEHRVQLLYRPWHLYAALALQALAALLWCAYPLLSRRKRGTSSLFV